MEQKYFLAMYDVRGIQNYIYNTPQVKDAIGASAIVEDIIVLAMKEAVKELELKAEIDWFNDDGALPFSFPTDLDMQVLYIGGGNAYALVRGKELCKEINKIMSKYVIRQTYSLQLACAFIEATGNYETDMTYIYSEMEVVKRNMIGSKPVGALPIIRTDKVTGAIVGEDGISIAKSKKIIKEQSVRDDVKNGEKIFDNFVPEKGIDSTLACVHIDGNNMGLRLRKLMNKISDYETAVNKIREISYSISTSYVKVFKEMEEFFNGTGKNKKNFILKILVAGDDITYVCNGHLALETVMFYIKHISNHEKYSMDPKAESKDKRYYGFSVCAGISYFNSHFPFYDAYVVAEECCESAKSAAKEPAHKVMIDIDGKTEEVIGNWVDFQICKNIQAKNLSEIRKREYVTATGENLIRRPYICGTESFSASELNKEAGIPEIKDLIKEICYFKDDKNIPRSFAKNIRNIYALGRDRMNEYSAFLKSRQKKMPDGSNEMYVGKTARWYDALEIMDLYQEV